MRCQETCSKLHRGVSVVAAEKVLVAKVSPVGESEDDAAVGHEVGAESWVSV